MRRFFAVASAAALLSAVAQAHEPPLQTSAAGSLEEKLRVQLDIYAPPPEPKPRPRLSLAELRSKSSTSNIGILGQTFLTWPGTGGQIALQGDYAYVALQPPAKGTDIVDVRNPERPTLVGHVDPPGPGVISHKVRICDGIMVTNAERNRYETPAQWQGGLVVWSLADPVRPRKIAFLPVPGEGVHRIFYDCPTKRVYMNANDDGFLDKIEWVVDMSDPTRPRRISRLWFPGQKDGEPRPWKPGHPFTSTYPDYSVRAHNVTPNGNILYAAWWDAGLTVWDVSNIESPRLLGNGSTSPPDQGSMHSAYPLRGYPIVVTSDEWLFSCPQGYVRIWNVKDPTRPLQISTFQLPIDKKCDGSAPGQGPIFQNSAHSFAEPPTLAAQDWPVHLIFATWFGQGLRVIDVSDPYAPSEVGHFLPPAWPNSLDLISKTPNFLANDVAVDWKRRLLFVTDRTDEGGAGLYVLKWTSDDDVKQIKFNPQ